MAQIYFVYIMANRRHGTIYIGVTNDLVRRVSEHRAGGHDGFTKTHDCTKLVWFDSTDDIDAAITHEKRLKKWLRPWKDELIEKHNPEWRDLWWDIIGSTGATTGNGVVPALSRDPS